LAVTQQVRPESGAPDHAAIHGLVRAIEESTDRVFVLGVDLPALPEALIREIARFGGNVDTMVPAPVARRLKERYGDARPPAGSA